MSGNSISPAWGGNRPTDDHDARERVLEAATRCIQRDGLHRASLPRIAAEAGVTKPTLYQYFSGRDDIMSQTLVRAAGAFVDRFRSALASVTDPSDYIVEGLVYAVGQIPKEPLLGRLVELLRADEYLLATAAGPQGVPVVRECLRPFEEMVPGRTESELDEIAEMILRVAISFILSPEPRRTPAQLRALLRRRVVPILGLPPRPTRTPRKRSGGRR